MPGWESIEERLNRANKNKLLAKIMGWKVGWRKQHGEMMARIYWISPSGEERVHNPPDLLERAGY